MTRRNVHAAAVTGILLAGLAVVVLTATQAHRANGGYGFPLDDAWIHLQFARNLHEYGAFSYFQDQQVTSGSSSPLYVALLAVGMSLTRHEFLLSYVLGTAFLLVSGLVTFRLGRRLCGGQLVVALTAAALVVLDPRLVWIALSGMETTLFLSLLLLSLLCHVERRPVWLGVCAGLSVWARPEGLLMIVILAIDALVVRERGRSRERLVSVAITAVLVAGYFAFNLALSGSVLPNTVAAKLRYYAGGGRDFSAQLLQFLAAGPMLAVVPFAAIGLGRTVLTVARRRSAPFLVPALWVVGMILAVAWKLPYLYQNGRYLLPILPFVFLLAMAGLQAVAGRVGPWGGRFRTGAVVVMVGVVLTAAWQRRADHAMACRYIDERQVATARWIREHLPEDAVVATHDVGALAYRSGRRIVDMVGLTSPRAIDTIGDPERLLQYLQGEQVTHLAVLRTWFSIANVTPLFMTDEMHPEVMEVFAFGDGRLHVTQPTAALLCEQARMELIAGNVQLAGALLERALTFDASTARIHFLLGRALLQVGRPAEARREFDAALALQPDLDDEVTSEMNP